MLPIRDLVVLGATLICLPFCFSRPFFGILVWTVIALLNPHRFTWGLMFFKFPIALVVAIPTLAGFLAFSPSFKRFFSRDVILLGVLWLWFTFTTLHNTQVPLFQHFSQDTWFRYGFVSKVLLMTLATVAVTSTWERFRYLLLVIAGCLGVLVLKGVPFMIMTGGVNRLRGPDGSMLADNNDFGLALNMTLPMFFFLAQIEPERRIRWVMGFLFLVTIPAIYFTYSRGALVGLAVVLLLMFLKLRQRLVLIPVLLMTFAFAVYLTPEKWQRRMDFRREGALLDDSAQQRLYAWTYSWRLAMDYPLTGAGFDAFTPPLYTLYAPDDHGLRPRGYVHGPHSIYFGVLAEHGFIGLFLYLSLILSCFLTLRKVGKYGRRIGNKGIPALASMFQLSLIGFMVSGAFLGRAYFDYFFMIVGCSIILHRLCLIEPVEMPLEDPSVEEEAA